MATTYYFRSSDASAGPTGKASTRTDGFPTVPSDKNTAKDMTTAAGTLETSQVGAYNSAGAAYTLARIFVGPALAAQTLTGGQAGYQVGIGIKESSTSMNLYHDTFVYVWRNGSGNVKTIIVATSCGTEHGTSQKECVITATGASGNFSIQLNDRIVVEEWWLINNAKSTEYTATDYYEGTTTFTADGTAATDNKSYFYCPQTLNEAAGAQYTKTHTTNTLLKKTTSKAHTTNALLKKTLTKAHTTNALLVKRTTKTHTTNAYLISRVPKAHATNALLLKTQTKTHTVNALLLKTATKTHTTNTNLLLRGVKTHTANALLKKTQTKTHSTNALLKATFSKAHTTNSFLKLVATKTHSTNALLLKTQTKSHTTNSLLKATYTLSHSTDAYLTTEAQPPPTPPPTGGVGRIFVPPTRKQSVLPISILEAKTAVLPIEFKESEPRTAILPIEIRPVEFNVESVQDKKFMLIDETIELDFKLDVKTEKKKFTVKNRDEK